MSACTNQIGTDLDLRDPTPFNKWKSTITTTVNQIGANPTGTVDDITNLNNISKDIANHMSCINEQTSFFKNSGTYEYYIQLDIDNINQTIAQRIKDVGVTQDRAILARNPGLTQSYYDSWFPVSRPLKQYTIPILIAFSLFFVSMTFFYFLTLMGIDMQLFVRIPQSMGGLHPQTAWTIRNKPFWGMAVVAITLLGLTIYGFAR